jgi:hypothetical protein
VSGGAPEAILPPQPDLPFSPNLEPLIEVSGFETQAEQFEAFHRMNPAVLRAIVRIARDQRNAGWERGSINLIYERLRWLWAIQTQGSAYRLNNNHRAYYARLAMSADPVLDGYFEVRRQPTEGDGGWSPDGLLEETWNP